MDELNNKFFNVLSSLANKAVREGRYDDYAAHMLAMSKIEVEDEHYRNSLVILFVQYCFCTCGSVGRDDIIHVVEEMIIRAASMSGMELSELESLFFDTINVCTMPNSAISVQDVWNKLERLFSV